MVDVTKQELEQWYSVEKLSTRAIAEKLETSQPTARKLMKEMGIEMRTYKDNKVPFKKGDKFSEEHKQKISKALKGNTNWLDKDTGKHFNYKKESVLCANCGKDITKKKSHIYFDRCYCSLKCEGEWKTKNTSGENSPLYTSQQVECKWCGNVLVRQKHSIDRSENFFCNVQCNGAWKSENLVGEKVYNYKGHPDQYRGKNWNQQRRKARQRDKDTCQRCYKTSEELGRNMDVHHIKPFREFGLKNYVEANDLGNLISYCNSCHKIVESELES